MAIAVVVLVLVLAQAVLAQAVLAQAVLVLELEPVLVQVVVNSLCVKGGVDDGSLPPQETPTHRPDWLQPLGQIFAPKRLKRAGHWERLGTLEVRIGRDCCALDERTQSGQTQGSPLQ